MFSKELEEVIEAALADGVITEKERAVLHKRAQAEGVDPDELDVVIDGRLSKMKKEEDWLRPVPPPQAAPANNGKHGVVRKCPSCGAPVEAGAVKCAECGYEFVGIEANNSVSRLSEMLRQIESQSSEGLLGNIGNIYGLNSKRINEMSSAISNFPVPTTKEDLLEFILFLQPKTKASAFSSDMTLIKLKPAYTSKYKECLGKAKHFFADDPQFQPFLKNFKGFKVSRLSNVAEKIQSIQKIIGAVIGIAFLIMMLIWLIF